jgi:hypothetical protein
MIEAILLILADDFDLFKDIGERNNLVQVQGKIYYEKQSSYKYFVHGATDPGHECCSRLGASAIAFDDALGENGEA